MVAVVVGILLLGGKSCWEPRIYTLDVITYSKFYHVTVNIQRWYSCLAQTHLVVLCIFSSHLVNRLYVLYLRSVIVIALHPPALPRSNLATYTWLVAATFYHIFVDTRIPELGKHRLYLLLPRHYITTKHSPMDGLKITTGRSSPRSLTTCSASDLLNVYVLGRLHRNLKYDM